VFLPAYIDPWSNRLVDLASPAPGQRALDVACGTGAWAVCAARRIGPTGQVIGIDSSADMLAVARRKQPGPLSAPVE
jgi:ubiquinone/menaquinone biosynthesis C-methylase UbiE